MRRPAAAFRFRANLELFHVTKGAQLIDERRSWGTPVLKATTHEGKKSVLTAAAHILLLRGARFEERSRKLLLVPGRET